MQLLDKTVEMRGSQVLNLHSYRSVVMQRRIMFAAWLLAWAGVAALIWALQDEKWATISFANTEFEQVRVTLGVWGEWRERSNETIGRHIVEWIPHFPAPPESVLRLANTDLKHYYRAQAAIGVISIILLLSTQFLALYTFYHHRYMFKRLTACLYAVSGMCVVVIIEVLVNSVNEWDIVVTQQSRLGEWDYSDTKETGRAIYVAWVVVGVCFFAALAFACGSHKQKGDMAATAEFEIEDRPVHIGR